MLTLVLDNIIKYASEGWFWLLVPIFAMVTITILFIVLIYLNIKERKR